MSETYRNEYLSKIRAVEELDKKGGYNTESEDSSGASLTSLSSFSGVAPTLSGSSTYEIPPVHKMPDKIQLPSGSDRRKYNNTSAAFAQEHIMNDDIYTTLDPQKFITRAARFKGEGRLRRDFVFYLEELHSQVAPRLGVTKLNITSTFRSKEHNDWIYRDSDHKVTDSPHMGAIAVDIACTGKDRYIVADTAYNLGFGGIAVGSDFVHIDIGIKSYWAYSPVPKYYNPQRKYG